MADDEFSVAVLVRAAARGDQTAWDDILDRYSPLLVNILRQCGLTAADTEDVAQTVWLRLVERLDSLREPEALPGWIITTGRREAWRQAASGRRVQVRDLETGERSRWAADADAPDDSLLRAERRNALLAGIAELSGRHRDLLLLFLEDPPPSYAEISRRTGIPIGGIGPTRARALAKLRETSPIQAIKASESDRPESAARAKR